MMLHARRRGGSTPQSTRRLGHCRYARCRHGERAKLVERLPPGNVSVGMAWAVFEQTRPNDVTCVLCLRGGGEEHESGGRSINLFAACPICRRNLGAVVSRLCVAGWFG